MSLNPHSDVAQQNACFFVFVCVCKYLDQIPCQRMLVYYSHGNRIWEIQLPVVYYFQPCTYLSIAAESLLLPPSLVRRLQCKGALSLGTWVSFCLRVSGLSRSGQVGGCGQIHHRQVLSSHIQFEVSLVSYPIVGMLALGRQATQWSSPWRMLAVQLFTRPEFKKLNPFQTSFSLIASKFLQCTVFFFIKHSDILGERGSEIQTFWFCFLQAFLLKGMYSVQSLSCI